MGSSLADCGGAHEHPAGIPYALRDPADDFLTLPLGSFRAGGATTHFLEHENLGTLQFRGR